MVLDGRRVEERIGVADDVNKPKGDNARKGAVRKRTQLKQR